MPESEPKGFISPEIAEICKTLGPDGNRCKLLLGDVFFQCQVKTNIYRYRKGGDIATRIKIFRNQIPDNCPLGYDKPTKR